MFPKLFLTSFLKDIGIWMGPEVASEVTVVCHTEEWRTQKDLVIYDAWQSIVQLQLSYFRHLQLLMLTKIDIGMLKYELV